MRQMKTNRCRAFCEPRSALASDNFLLQWIALVGRERNKRGLVAVVVLRETQGTVGSRLKFRVAVGSTRRETGHHTRVQYCMSLAFVLLQHVQ